VVSAASPKGTSTRHLRGCGVAATCDDGLSRSIYFYYYPKPKHIYSLAPAPDEADINCATHDVVAHKVCPSSSGERAELATRRKDLCFYVGSGEIWFNGSLGQEKLGINHQRRSACHNLSECKKCISRRQSRCAATIEMVLIRNNQVVCCFVVCYVYYKITVFCRRLL
jgi:hypothetical protein